MSNKKETEIGLAKAHERGQVVGEFSGRKGISHIIITAAGFTGRMTPSEKEVMHASFIHAAVCHEMGLNSDVDEHGLTENQKKVLGSVRMLKPNRKFIG